MRARDIMTSPAHVIRQNATVVSAAELMTAKSVTALPVVDADGQLVGMVSESDLLWHRVPADPTTHAGRHPDTEPDHRPATVAEIMSAYPLVTTPGADIADVADAMLQHDVRSMPVLDDRAVVGVFSRRDIIRAVVRGDDVLAREVQHRLDEYAGGERRWTAAVEDAVVTVTGQFDNDTERVVVGVLARTVPGVAAATLVTPAVS
jgi:CBS domain-containing protein